MAVTETVTRRIPAGWYPDRNDRSRRQWFDGREWTEYYSAAPKAVLTLAAAPRVRAECRLDEIVVEYDEAARPTIRSAITFRDRVPAILLSGLVVGNIVVVGFFAHVF